MADAILVDANLLLWAHHAQFPQHAAAHRWWAGAVEEVPLVGIPWATVLAFLRISTHPRVFERPLTVAAGWDIVQGWGAQRAVRWIVPSARHEAVLGDLLQRAQAGGNHTTDAHLAALAVEWGLELQSADADFARYPGLRWRNPLAAG